MKRYLLLLLLFCGLAMLAHAQTVDTTKKPPLPADGLDLDAPAVDDSKIFTTAEVMPAYPGGRDSLDSYLAKHLVYPPAALNAHLGGVVALTFVVNRDGSVSNVRVVRSQYGRLSAEAVRVVSSLKFIPATQNGQPVRVMFDLAVRFDPANPHKFD